MNTNILKFSIISILFFISILVFTISCQNKNESIIEIKKSVKQLNDSKISGYISLTSKNINNKSSVELEAHLFGLKPGESAIHIHEFADCSSIDGLSLGGHWNPTSQPHGKWGNEEGLHLGDIGNFSVDSIGHGMVKFKTDLWCINCSDKPCIYYYPEEINTEIINGLPYNNDNRVWPTGAILDNKDFGIFHF